MYFLGRKKMFAERSLDLSRPIKSYEVKRGLHNISPQATYVYATKNSKIPRKRTSKNTGREENGPGIMWLPFFCVATPQKRRVGRTDGGKKTRLTHTILAAR